MSLPKVALSLPIIWLLGSELFGKVPLTGLEVSGLQGDLNPKLFDQVKMSFNHLNITATLH